MNTTYRRCVVYHQPPAGETIITDGPCTIMLASIGLVGNMYGLRQLGRIQLAKNFRIYLFTLSLWDMALLTFAIVQYGLLNVVFLVNSPLYHLPIWSYFAKLLQGPLVTALTGSCWTTVAIAVMRYFCIARPTPQTDDKIRLTQVICVLISLAAVCYCLPVHFEMTLSDCFDPVTARNEVQIWPLLFANNSYRLYYHSYAYLVFVSVGPFVTILGLSVRTLLLVRRSIERTLSNTASRRSNRRQRKMAILFSVLLLKFLVCNFAASAVFFVTSVVDKHFLNKLPTVTLSLCNLTALMHNATNFLLYLPWYKSKFGNESSTRTNRTLGRQPTTTAADLKIKVEEIQPLFESQNTTTLEVKNQEPMEDVIL